MVEERDRPCKKLPSPRLVAKVGCSMSYNEGVCWDRKQIGSADAHLLDFAGVSDSIKFTRPPYEG